MDSGNNMNDKKEQSLYLNRILSGRFSFIYGDKQYCLLYPDIDTKYRAELYAQNEYEKNKFNEWIQDEDILYWLIDAGLWNPHMDKQLEALEKQIENLKIDLYNSFLNPDKQKKIRRTLESIRKQYNKFYGIRHSFDHLTVSGYCDGLKTQIILIEGLRDSNNNKIFSLDDLNDGNSGLFYNLAQYINEHTIDISMFKALARGDMWRSYWSANKDYVFDKPVTEWTDEQKTLVVLTKMYDSAYEHPECPDDKVIEDDDMFDGWMLVQRKENEENKKKRRSEKLLEGKNLGNAKEVFLVASSKEEAENIYNLNDGGSRNTIKERQALINRAGKDIKEADLPDVQRDLVMQQTQMMKQNKR